MFLWGDGTGNFVRQQVNGPMGLSLSSGDVNGDGIPDIVIPDRFGIISVALGRKDRNIPIACFHSHPMFRTRIAAGDVSGNHKLDLLSPATTPAKITLNPAPGNLYMNQGRANSSRPESAAARTALADMDGDGVADLVGTDGPATSVIWKGTGDPNFGSRAHHDSGAASHHRSGSNPDCGYGRGRPPGYRP